jgi:hypothetical protein
MERLKATTLHDPAEKLLEKYCAEARQLVNRAESEEEALEIRKRLCARFAQECSSELIMNATQTYIDDVIRRIWEKKPGTTGRQD